MSRSSRRKFIWSVTGLTSAMACGRAATSAPTQESGAVDPGGSVPEPDDVEGAATPSQSSSDGVPRRQLGSTGESVSMLGLGGFHIGKADNEQESISLIRAAIDGGINFLDNCWDYNEGQSELRMGKALQNGYRQRAFLMTKIDGRDRESAKGQLEQSLRRLQTDTIDLVQIHEIIRESDPERCFAPGGAIEALVQAREAGKLRFIGFTGHKHPDLHIAMLDVARKHDFRFDTVQMPLNVMDAHYESFEGRVLPRLVSERIGVLGMKSMGGGDILRSGVVEPEECLRYALSLPTSVVISGMDNRRVLEKNLELARSFRSLPESELKSLLSRTEAAAQSGSFELFKTSKKYDGTARNPHWLERAEL